MKVQFLSDEEDYQKAIKILQNKKNKVLSYDSAAILQNPITLKRKALHLSQRDLAKKMKVDPAFISRLEKTGSNPSKTTLLKLASALGCSAEELL